jgi:hypothetical protein
MRDELKPATALFQRPGAITEGLLAAAAHELKRWRLTPWASARGAASTPGSAAIPATVSASDLPQPDLWARCGA